MTQKEKKKTYLSVYHKERLKRDDQFRKKKAEYCRTWRRDNPNYTREYKKKNAEAVKRQKRISHQKRPWLTAAHKLTHKNRKRGANFTNDFSAAIKIIYQKATRVSRCLKIPHEVDHVIPLCAGGSNHPTNLQVLPKVWNARKSGSVGYALPDCYLTK